MAECKRCNGVGTITCMKCSGFGQSYTWSDVGFENCSRCMGIGELRCPACLGAGEVISYADRYKGGQIETEFEYNFDVFVSHSLADKKEADKIYIAIMTAGGRAFASEKDIEPGEDFAEEIRKAISFSRELWLLVSPNSINSDWVISEWGAAWVLRKKVVPILLRCGPEQLPDRLRRLHCIDFHEYPDLVNNTFQKEQKE